MDRNILKQITEDPESLPGRIFDLSIQCVIIVWLVVYSVDTLPNLEPSTRWVLNQIEVAVSLLFSVEYLLRIYNANRRLAFVFGFWGIIDLIAVLPFYLSFAPGLRSVRILRLLRLVRILKLGRFSRALQRLRIAAEIAKDEFLMFITVALLLLFLAAAGIHHFESQAQPEKFSSIFESLWWAVATLTTVGYGDIYPITTGGKVFTFAILMLGLGIVAVPTGLITSAITQARKNETKRDSETEHHSPKD